VVAADLTEANGYAEREAAESDDRASCTGRLSLGADKGYDAFAFVADLRALNATLQSHRA